MIAQLVAQQQLVKMKRGDTRKQKSIEFLIDVPIGSLKDEPEDNSRVWPGKRRLVAQMCAHICYKSYWRRRYEKGEVNLKLTISPLSPVYDRDNCNT